MSRWWWSRLAAFVARVLYKLMGSPKKSDAGIVIPASPVRPNPEPETVPPVTSQPIISQSVLPPSAVPDRVRPIIETIDVDPKHTDPWLATLAPDWDTHKNE